MPANPKNRSPWLAFRSLPEPLETSSFVLEPLDGKHAELDFAALMSCRARLRKELQWGDWPPQDFTVELNRLDLREHGTEFRRHEAFAYSVLSPDRARCIGCIYIERCAEIDGAQLSFWMIDEALHAEEDLIRSVLAWIQSEWLINRVLLPLREENSRGLELARNLGLATLDKVEDEVLLGHRCFLFETLERDGERAPATDT